MSVHCVLFLVCLRASPFRENFFLPFLAVMVVLSFVLALAFAITGLAFALVRAVLAFGFVVRARPSARLVVLQVFGFLSTISRHVTVSSTP